MQSPGSINNYFIGLPTARCLQGIKDHRSRVSTGLMGNNVGA